MPSSADRLLASVFGLVPRELVSFVGGGGKTSLLQMLAEELSGSGERVVATTTTSMYLRELARVGPVVIEPDRERLILGLRGALARATAVGAGRALGDEAKVTGLSATRVDEVWTEGLSDFLLVEADGSRGRPLKMFAPHEPVVPASTTTVVQTAGLDAVGRSLTSDWVHRPELVAGALGVAVGSPVTAAVFGRCLREQLALLRERVGPVRVVTFLNKADDEESVSLGRRVARELRTFGSPPDLVVVGSCKQRRFLRVD